MAKYNPITYYAKYCKEHNIIASPQKLVYWFNRENVSTKVKKRNVPPDRTKMPELYYEKTEAIVVIDTYLQQ